MLMKKAVILSILGIALICGLIGLAPTQAQKPLPTVLSRPFEPGEELFYEAEFSRSLLRKLDVADFKFRASRVASPNEPQESSDPTNAQPYSLTFNVEIASKGFFTWLFNLHFRERVESTVEPASFTVQRTTIHDEQGKRVRMSEATFDREKGQMSWTQRDPNNPEMEPRNIVTEFSGQLQDVLSAFYFIRTKHLQIGKSFEVFIGDGGRVYKVPVKVVAKKRMKTILGKVDVLRVEPELFGPDRMINDEKGQFSIWITDDNRHVPVSSRIKTRYGTFDIRLKRVAYNPPT
jgi:hypothetical protein